MKPVIKWAGGKSQLLEHIRAMMPEDYGHYYELFLGGGAVLLDIEPENATVNDINSELVNMYTQIKHAPYEVMIQNGFFNPHQNN